MSKHANQRPAFTLLELLLVLGVVGILASIVIVAINPSQQLESAQNAKRKSMVREQENAMMQYLIGEGRQPAVGIPTGEQQAKPICQSSVHHASCINLDDLVPEYVAALPVDSSMTGVVVTGYRVYNDNALRPHVCSDYLPNDARRCSGSVVVEQEEEVPPPAPSASSESSSASASNDFGIALDAQTIACQFQPYSYGSHTTMECTHSFDVRITNNTPTTNGTSFTISLPVSGNNYANGMPCSIMSNLATCTINNIPAGSSTMESFVMRITGGATFDSQLPFSVDLPAGDNDAGNDSANGTLTVQSRCGDAFASGSESCDSGGVNTYACDYDCSSVYCADGVFNAVAGEQCDDGNNSQGDGCNSSCQIEVCGNSVVDAGEACDMGTSDSISCDGDCSAATCGDGHVNTQAGESCEDGNTNSGDGCSSTCTIEF